MYSFKLHLKAHILNDHSSKANRLEIHKQTEDGLQLLHGRNVYGKVMMLEKLRPLHSNTDHLFVGTDRYMYFTVSWNRETRQLQTEKGYVDQADKSFRDSQSQDRCQIDPNSEFMALLLYDGIVTVMPILQRLKKKGSTEHRGIGDPIPARISDLFVRSFAFLHSRPNDKFQHKMAFLFENNHQKVCLSVRALDYSPGLSGEPDTADLENVRREWDDIELGASHLIPVPAPACKCFKKSSASFSHRSI